MPQLKIEGQDGPKNEPKKATLGLTEDQEDKFAKERAKQEEEFARKTAAIDKAKGGEITGALEATNKKKEEDDRFNAAIEAEQAAAKPAQVIKPTTNTPPGTMSGNAKVTDKDPKQPKQYNPSTISSELWIFNFGVAFSSWAYMRHVHAIKKDGLVDNKGLKHQLAKAWNAGPVWYAIGAGVAAVKYAMGGKMTKPLTEENLKEFIESHPEYGLKIAERQLNEAKEQLDIARQKGDPKDIKDKEEKCKIAKDKYDDEVVKRDTKNTAKDTASDPQSPSVNTPQKNSTLSSLGNKFQETAKTLSSLASNLSSKKTSQEDQRDREPVLFSNLSDHNKPRPATPDPAPPITPTHSQPARRPSLR